VAIVGKRSNASTLAVSTKVREHQNDEVVLGGAAATLLGAASDHLSLNVEVHFTSARDCMISGRAVHLVTSLTASNGKTVEI